MRLRQIRSHFGITRLGLLLGALGWVWLGSLTAQPANSPPGEAERGWMRRVTPKSLVVGETFKIALALPKASEQDAGRSLSLYWYPTGAPLGPGATEGTVAFGLPVHSGPEISRWDSAPPDLTLTAPFHIAPPHEEETLALRLIAGMGSSNDVLLLDSMRVKVTPGRVTDGIVLTKRVYRIGEPIVTTVNLPPNRYYQGVDTGPNVVVYPIEVHGEPATKEQIYHAHSSTWGCHGSCASLRGQAWIPDSQNVYGGLATRPGRYLIAPGVKDQEPLIAPELPGKYEVRLYDRGFSDSYDTYEHLYLQKVPITVEAPFLEESATSVTSAGPGVGREHAIGLDVRFLDANHRPLHGPLMLGIDTPILSAACAVLAAMNATQAAANIASRVL